MALAQAPGDCSQEDAALLLRDDLRDDAVAGVDIEGTLYPGQSLELDVTAFLRVDDVCVSSFAIAVAHPQPWVELVSVTREGTDSQAYIPGFSITEATRSGDGFVAVAVAGDPCPPLEGGGGSIGSFPRRGLLSLVFARYRIVPQDGPRLLEGRIEYRDGLRGSGLPVDNQLHGEGDSLHPCTETLSLRFEVVDTVDFVRGDANFDGRLDISDPVTVLRASFHGDTRIRCDDAADANDDSAIDISDAVHTFSYLYLGRAPPPAPFPAAGSDPTDDALRCRP